MKLKALFLAVFILMLFSPLSSQAASYCSFNRNFDPHKYACVVVESRAGLLSVLHNQNANQPRYPASLTKLMTLYLTFDALKYKKISLDSYLPVSRHAASQPSMKIDLTPGQKIPLRTLVNSMVVVSANDSAVVVAERIGGTEKNFARLMNQKAHQLGMRGTNFANASGLYNSRQVTTAMDMAKLMIAIKHDFPQYYHLLSLTHFSYKGVHYGPHTKLIKNYKWAKAAKTGFISQSGFNLVLSAKKNNENIVAVVMGGNTAGSRDHFMKVLLDATFNTSKKKSRSRVLIQES